MKLEISDNEKQFLIQVVRGVIRAGIEGREYSPPPFQSELFNRKYGLFVSLHKHGELRGCIGYVEGIKPLLQAVIDMAEAAAFRDPRFEPVTKDELDDLEIEISVLSPLQEIKSIDEIVIGEHGLVIERGFAKGLLLPQVATEYNWDRNTFLEHICVKAGLPKDAWQDPKSKIYTFSAVVFSA